MYMGGEEDRTSANRVYDKDMHQISSCYMLSPASYQLRGEKKDLQYNFHDCSF